MRGCTPICVRAARTDADAADVVVGRCARVGHTLVSLQPGPALPSVRSTFQCGASS
jgi:hypothetical protein